MNTISIVAGRFLLGLLFLVAGTRKFSDTERMVEYMQAHDIIFASKLIIVAALANVIGGLLLISGRHVKLAAYGFVVYLLLVNFLLHNFWAMPAEQAPHETQNFIKNLGIIAGLLITAGYSTLRPLSLKDWWKSDKQFG